MSFDVIRLVGLLKARILAYFAIGILMVSSLVILELRVTPQYQTPVASSSSYSSEPTTLYFSSSLTQVTSSTTSDLSSIFSSTQASSSPQSSTTGTSTSGGSSSLTTTTTTSKISTTTHSTSSTSTSSKSTSSSSATTSSPGQAPALRVSGNELLNATRQPVHLVGVNVIAGTGACVPGENDSGLSILYDGGLPNVQVAKEMAGWHINVVRITPNEDCWLGINGVNSTVSGANYRDAIVNFVGLLNSYGIYAIIDLHSSAPGSWLAIGEQPMADQDHSVTYWQSVASTFKNNSAVIFEPYNEPHITTANAQTTNPWECWLEGCNITIVQGYGDEIRANSTSWRAAGMQELVDTIRATGATNPILIGGLNWSQNLTQLLHYLPTDPDNQLIANYHNYAGPANNMNYWNDVILPVSQKMPVITSEFGESDCQSSFVDQYMAWADSHNISYLPWVWTDWQCNAYGLLSNWDGTPSAYGEAFYQHFEVINP